MARSGSLFILLAMLAFPFVGQATNIDSHLQSIGYDKYDREFRNIIGRQPADDLAKHQTSTFCSEREIQPSNPVDGKFFDSYRHEKLPIYYLHFKSAEMQDLMLDRMVTYADDGAKDLHPKKTQKPGYEGDDGMNISSDDIASFYTKMEVANHNLTAAEQRLLDSLLKNGDLKRLPGGEYEATRKFALISSSADSGASTSRHELRHALYVTVPTYRQKLIALYEGLSEEDKKLVKKILNGAGGHTPEKGMEVFYTEFGAYFEDPKELESYFTGSGGLTSGEKKRVNYLAQKVQALEREIPEFSNCDSESPRSTSGRSKSISGVR